MEKTIIDVRSEAEFQGGHANGSINIPVQKIPQNLEQIKAMKNIVLCCASGGRSAQAAMYLKQNGIACTDAGSWFNV
ncbi:MAG: rhodanese-like domain-containing protein [Sphingobacteriaceae bacterium]|nr:rhodanese-like domain-containing protein [Sphingobacteriaceae bacterium]